MMEHIETKTAAQQKPKKNLKYQRDKDRELVKGIFRFHEVPGGTMQFTYCAYKEDPVENFSLTDGQVYTLPLGVARHLNKNCWYPQYDYMKGEDIVSGYNPRGGYQGSVGMRISKKVRRCSFQSLEFMDADDLTESKIVEVTSLSPL